MTRSIATTLLLAAATALAEPASDAPIVEPDLAHVSDIKVEGNRRVESAVVKNALSTKIGGAFDATRIRADVKSLWKLGYFEDIEVRGVPGPTGLVLWVRVVEKPAIREVRLSGNKELSNDDLKDLVEVKAYSILDRAALRRVARKIQEKYVEKGYFLSEVTYRVDSQPENEVDVVLVINENAKVMVKRVSFVGNTKVPSEDLRAAMQTSEGDIFSFLTSSGTYREEVFQRDISLVQGVYFDRGYINVKVGRPEISLTSDKRFIYIAIPVDEGEPYTVGKVDFSGDIEGATEQLSKKLVVRSSDVFSRSKLQQDILALTDVYQDQGYAYANVTPLTAMDADKRTIDLTYDVRKGRKVYIERIEIAGNSKTRDKVIRRELRVYEGELFTGSGMRLSRQRVTALGFFETVEVTQRKGSAEDRIILTVDIKEKPTGTFQVGFGFSSQENFIFTAQVSQNNVFGWGQTVSLGAQITGMRSLFQLSYIDPYFLDTPWIFSFDAYRTEWDYGGFLRRAFGGGVTWGYHILDDVMVHVGYMGEDVSTDVGTGGQRIPGVMAAFFTSALRFTVNWDRRDNRLFPTSGFFQGLTVEYAPAWLGSQFVFTRFTGYSRWYFPLFWGIVFKVNATGGYIMGDKIPPSELYRLGGINNVRGYPINTLSPMVRVGADMRPDSLLNDYPIGGNKQAFFNAELEFPIIEKVGIRGVLFYDMGNAFGVNENLFAPTRYGLPLGMFHSVGFGFRWFSPIGPLRFEWGHPLTPRPGIDTEFLPFQFTIGNFF